MRQKLEVYFQFAALKTTWRTEFFAGLTTSIANGLGFGIIAWAALRLFTGRITRKDWLLCALALLFLARFIYVGGT
jgi:xanthine/uracil/vitamin C permease (AzgA family)